MNALGVWWLMNACVRVVNVNEERERKRVKREAADWFRGDFDSIRFDGAECGSERVSEWVSR